jgi:hypothetical protein
LGCAAVAADWKGGYLAGEMPQRTHLPAIDLPAMMFPLKEFPPKAGR